MQGAANVKTEAQDEGADGNTDEMSTTPESSSREGTKTVKTEDQDEEKKGNPPLKICHLRQTGQVFTPVELIKAYSALCNESFDSDFFPKDRFRAEVLNDLRAGHLFREGHGKDVKLWFDPYHPYNNSHSICGTSPEGTCTFRDLPKYPYGGEGLGGKDWRAIVMGL
jgi:hypothetical protein